MAKKQSRFRRIVALLIKLLVTVVCFWYIGKKIDFSQSLLAVQNANWLLLAAAVVLYAFSKWVSAHRLNIYFQNIGIALSPASNLKLYWLGMFYNLFLPGSISGDAYKVVLLNKRFGAPYKKTSAAVLLDRFSGLLGLGVLSCGYAVALLFGQLWDLLLIGGLVAAIVAFYLLVRKLFPEFLPGFRSTLLLGVAVQAIQVLGVYAILEAMRIGTDQHQWILVFLIASVFSVLPISLGGGLGTRELAFAQGAELLGLKPELGVLVSLLFYLSSVAASVWGLRYVFQDPLPNPARHETEKSVR